MDRRRHLAAVVALAALGALALPRGAHAQDQERARQLFERGVAAMDGGNPGAASGYFQQSYSLYPRASTACNMALSLERTGRQCDAEGWYRQCAALDQEGRFRDHANRQAAALSAQCQGAQQPTHNPFVTGPESTAPSSAGSAGGSVQVVESGGAQPQPMSVGRSPSHALLGVGIAALVLGGGGFVGGWAAAEESWADWAYVNMRQPGGGTLREGTPEADAYHRANTFRNVAIGLYVGGGVLGALGLTLIIVDLVQPGVFGGSARSSGPVRFTLSPTDGGAFGRLQLVF